MKNQELKDLIKALEDASAESGKAIWKALAGELDTAKRRRVAVNLSRINRHTEEGAIVAVPGKVLAAGNLDHRVKIAAYQFSEGALAKIKRANSEAVKLTELYESAVEPSKIKIMK